MDAKAMITSNISRLEDLLAEPEAEMTLEDLARHLNELASFRQNVRVAFCKKLARVYFIIVGSKPISPGETGHRGYAGEVAENRKKFFLWCRVNLRSGSGKEYTTTTLATYVGLGFKAAPEKVIAAQIKAHARLASNQRKATMALVKAIDQEGPRALAPSTLRKRYTLAPNIAAEVNALMTAWEQASSEARKQFLYLVTDRKMSA